MVKKKLSKLMMSIFIQIFSIIFMFVSLSNPTRYFRCTAPNIHTEVTLPMKRMHFVGTNFDTRGRITIKGIERCTFEDEFLSCKSVGCYTLPFAPDGG